MVKKNEPSAPSTPLRRSLRLRNNSSATDLIPSPNRCSTIKKSDKIEDKENTEMNVNTSESKTELKHCESTSECENGLGECDNDDLVDKMKKRLSEIMEKEETEVNAVNGTTNDAIDSKIDDLLLKTTFSESEPESEQNSFVDTMAVEGEEDTPSEDSNEIVDLGEEINTTESSLSSDESYDKNSFIDDEEKYQLLSGEEYDLSIDEDRKRKRIIEFSSGSEDEIIRIEKPPKKTEKKRRKSRIIRVEDSSDEEKPHLKDNNDGKDNDNKVGQEDNEKSDSGVSEVSGFDEVLAPVEKEENLVENLDDKKTSQSPDVSVSEKEDKQINEDEVLAPVEKEENLDDKKTSQSPDVSVSEKEDKQINKEQKNNFVSLPFKANEENKKVVILENIRVQDITDKDLSDQISGVINSVCTQRENIIEETDVAFNDNLNEEKKKKKRRKKRKKNHEINNEQCSLKRKRQNLDSEHSPLGIKRRKKNRRNKSPSESCSVMNILDEAILNNSMNRVPLLENDVFREIVDVRQALVKTEKHQKCEQVEKVKKTKFHHKDFRNMMIYDNRRNKRLETKEYIKKKTC